MTKVFKIRAFGFGELSQEHLPNNSRKSATQFLSKSIQTDEQLKKKLEDLNYKSGSKLLSPKMVASIVDVLEESY
ncbi:MAG: hypothetical protein AUJ98_05305 [Bacteroidetes bacterium CG2_30_33_31]|nr:MAG: hypothetical protein AUJ98_05305 [Bacteroidetes bacterium CG2_30_33_31]